MLMQIQIKEKEKAELWLGNDSILLQCLNIFLFGATKIVVFAAKLKIQPEDKVRWETFMGNVAQQTKADFFTSLWFTE